MEIRTIPRLSEEARPYYERAYHDANKYRLLSIELDTFIENACAQALARQIDLKEALLAVDQKSVDVLQATTKADAHSPTSTITDLNRVLAIGSFATERFLAPLLYSLDSDHMQPTRRRVADGTEGKSADLIENYLDMIDGVLKPQFPAEQLREVRGAIQENTVMALLNTDQSGQRLALPSTTAEDLGYGTDIYFYRYNHPTSTGFRHSISVKSTNSQKSSQAETHPDLIIISSEEFGNLGLRISRLLVKRNKGAPGLTDMEEAEVNEARDTVFKSVTTQLQARATEYPLQEELRKFKNDELEHQLLLTA